MSCSRACHCWTLAGSIFLSIRSVQLEADINELDVEAVFAVEIDLVALAQSEEHRPGRHLVAPVVAVAPSGGVEEANEAAGVLGVVVGVEGDGDLVDPGDLAAEHPRADVQAGLGLVPDCSSTASRSQCC